MDEPGREVVPVVEVEWTELLMDEALEVEVRQAADGESTDLVWAEAGQVWAEVVVVVEVEWLETGKRKLNISFSSLLPKQESLSAKVSITDIRSRLMFIKCLFACKFYRRWNNQTDQPTIWRLLWTGSKASS